MVKLIIRLWVATFLALGLMILVTGEGSARKNLEGENAVRLVVNRQVELGSAESISNLIAVQGVPWDAHDRFEAKAWKDLGMRTDVTPLLNDESYWPSGGIQVWRATEPPVAECAGGARGPFGPQNDLWLCMDEFERYLQEWQTVLGTDLRQTVVLDVMPRTLSFNPDSPNWMSMSPRDPEEWSAVMRATGQYLAEIGWNEPLVFLFGEYENLFYGKDRPLYDGTPETATARAEDYAELYMLTQNALQEQVPQVRVAGAISGTFSRDITRDLQQNPYGLGIEDWLEALQRLDPTFEPSAIGWQGYYWYGLDGYGEARLLEGAAHIRGVLSAMGYRADIPQYLDGWNGTFGNREAVDGSMSDDARLMLEAAHLTSSVIEMAEIGSPTRQIETAFYYTWNLDGQSFPDYRCGFPYQSLVSTIHGEIDLGDPDGCVIPASDVECKRAPYHAFKFLSELRDGDFVETKFEGSGGSRAALRVAAVKKRGATDIVVVNRTGAALAPFRLVVKGLAPRQSYTVTFNTIQPGEQGCAQVVTRARRIRADRHGTLAMPFAAPGDALAQIRIRTR